MELQEMPYSMENTTTLKGFSNLKTLKFTEASIHLSQRWLPSLPLKRLVFQDCRIKGTELGFLPLVKKLVFRRCRMKPLRGHLPHLESLIFLKREYKLDGDEEDDNERVLITKENPNKVKSFTLSSTRAGQFDLSSFEELKNLQLVRSYKVKRLDCLNVETLERVTIERYPKLKVNFPRL